MSVNKKLLEQKSDKELLQYVHPESRFTRTAIQYALEILQARGHAFTEDEIIRINGVISEKEKKDEVIVSADQLLAAKLMYLTGVIGILNLVMMRNSPLYGSSPTVGIISVAFIFGIGVLISKGFEWMKYILLIIMLLGLLAFPFILYNIMSAPVIGIANVVQTILQIYALVLLFKKS